MFFEVYFICWVDGIALLQVCRKIVHRKNELQVLAFLIQNMHGHRIIFLDTIGGKSMPDTGKLKIKKSDIEYFYSVHSAFAYLGAAQLNRIAQAAGVKIIHRPMNLGQVVRAAHPDGPAKRSAANKNYYFGREIERWAEHRGVSFMGGIPNNHRNDVTLANCVLIGAAELGQDVDRLSLALMRAHWAGHMDLADEDLLRAEIGKIGLNGDELLDKATSAPVMAQYERNSAVAIERGVFGSPTYFIAGDMFYGQDHLELVERALTKAYAHTWPLI